MQLVNEIQGSQGWLDTRRVNKCASEAPAMMGDSLYMTRDQLLKLKHTGEAEPVTPALQAIFDRGHATEAAIRPHIEKLIDDQLYNVTGIEVVEGLSLLASFDGLTMDETIAFEHKLWNKETARLAKAGEIEAKHYWQLEHQLLVSGAEKVIFVVSDGTPDNMEYVWYVSVPERRKKLIAGWKQFDEDLKNYVFEPESELVKAEVVLDLPAVSINVKGEIALIDNLDVFGDALKTYIKNINQEPENDQDFANLESAVKTLKKAEEALNAAENGALAQTTSIDEMRRTVELYRTMAKNSRLTAEKLVKSQKEVIKNKIVTEAKTNLDEHVSKLNAGLGSAYIGTTSANFPAAIKNKRTITSLKSATNNELARVKIEVNEQAETIRTNLASLNELASDYMALFNDLHSIVHKANDDFILLVNARVDEQKKAEEKRLEDDRERIRLEEEAKAKAAAEKAAEQAKTNEQKQIDETGLKEVLAEALEEVENIQPEEVPAPDNKVSPMRKIEQQNNDVYLKVLLSKKIGVDSDDISDEFLNILVWIGKGIAWSEELHLNAKILAEQVQEKISSEVSARA